MNAKPFTFILDEIIKEINNYKLRKFNITLDLMTQKVKICKLSHHGENKMSFSCHERKCFVT